jgi:uroporphyrinogen decarboxylase
MDMTYTYVQAARGHKTSHVPIWFMRQAGRYMQSFRKIREKYSFLQLVRTPELAAEVTLQPIRAYGFDAAILFSDILVMADVFDLDLSYIEGTGPRIGKRICHKGDLQPLSPHVVNEKLSYVMQAITCTKEQLKPLHTPLIGFCGAPFTVASYMLGDSQGDAKKTIKWCMRHQELLHEVLAILSDASIVYLKAQAAAGVDALQIFESWNSWLSWTGAEEFSTRYIQRIIREVKGEYDIPITVFGTANSNFYPQLISSGADVIGFDSKIDLGSIKETIPQRIGIQGNLDPHFFFGSKAQLLAEVDRILSSMSDRNAFIFNLGHGILPETPEDMVKLVVDRVKGYKRG